MHVKIFKSWSQHLKVPECIKMLLGSWHLCQRKFILENVTNTRFSEPISDNIRIIFDMLIRLMFLMYRRMTCFMQSIWVSVFAQWFSEWVICQSDGNLHTGWHFSALPPYIIWGGRKSKKKYKIGKYLLQKLLQNLFINYWIK